MSSVTYTSRISEAAAKIDNTADRLVRKYALDISGAAVRRAPYRTGYLKSTGTTHSPRKMMAEIIFSANYAVFVEFGTRRMSARPYLGPTFAAMSPAFIQAMHRMVKVLGS